MKRIVFASLFTLLIIGAVTVGYFYYYQLKLPPAEAVNAIPEDAVYIIECKNGSSSWKKLSSSDIWKHLAAGSYFAEIDHRMRWLDSLFSSYPQLQQITGDQPLFISAHPLAGGELGFLFISGLKRAGQETALHELISSIAMSRGITGTVSKRQYDGETLREIEMASSGKKFSWTVVKGLFIAGFSPAVLEESIRQLRKGTPFMSDINFKQVYDAKGSKVDANIYLSYRSFLYPAAGYFSNAHRDYILSILPGFSCWSGLDAKIRPHSIALSGFTVSSDSGTWLSALKGQKAGPSGAPALLPRKTSLFLSYSLSDPEEFSRKLSSCRKLFHSGEGERNEKMLDRLTQEYGTDFREKIISWTGTELTFAIVQPTGNDLKAAVFVLIKASDIIEAGKSLGEMNKTIAEKNKTRTSEESYRGHRVGFLDCDSLLYRVFGSMFVLNNKFFYTTLSDYVVIGNQASSIRSFIDDFIAEKTLSRDPAYLNFSDNIAPESNFYFFINPSRSAAVLNYFGSGETAGILDGNKKILEGLNGIAFQLTAAKGKFFNNVFISHTPEKEPEKETEMLWAAPLDTTVSRMPEVVINHTNKKKEVIVQDDANILYLIDQSGNILWKDSLPEPILGKIYQVDALKNNKLQYLFCTATSLYLIDRKGNSVDKFPIRLPSAPVVPLSVFDYERKKEYRLFVAGEDGSVTCYQVNGKEVEGWKFSKTMGRLVRPVQHISVKGKDYLILCDSTGSVFIVDRKGKTVADVKEKIAVSPHNEFYADYSGSNKIVRFVTTDTAGKVYSIGPDGAVKMESVLNGTAGHRFICKDMNADQVPEYIFLNDNTLTIHERKTKTIVNYPLPGGSNAMNYFLFSNGKGKIGITSISSGELFLINDDGSLYPGLPLKGSTPFSIDDFLQDNRRYLVTGAPGGKVFVYRIE